MLIRWVEKKESQFCFLKDAFQPVMTLEEYLTLDDYHCCEVRMKNKLAAISMVRVDKAEDRMMLMYTLVKPEFRKQGINSGIKTAVENRAKDLGLQWLYGHVRESNVASKNSLLKSGFTIFDEGDLFYKDGERKLTIRKKLN